MTDPPPSGGSPSGPQRSVASASEAERALAVAVRDACRAALSSAWEEARLAGLCDDGAWEAALGALSRLTPQDLIERARR